MQLFQQHLTSSFYILSTTEDIHTDRIVNCFQSKCFIIDVSQFGRSSETWEFGKERIAFRLQVLHSLLFQSRHFLLKQIQFNVHQLVDFKATVFLILNDSFEKFQFEFQQKLKIGSKKYITRQNIVSS